MRTHDEYLQAATILWGDAGAYMVTTYAELNRDYFDGELPPIPMTIAMVPYGKCLGATAPADHVETPRVVLAPEIFNGSSRLPGGARRVRDTILHEMIHVKLRLERRDPKHHSSGWSQEVMRLSEPYLGETVLAAPTRVARETLPDGRKGKPVRVAVDGAIPYGELARWPYSRRPERWDTGPPLPVATY